MTHEPPHPFKTIDEYFKSIRCPSGAFEEMRELMEAILEGRANLQDLQAGLAAAKLVHGKNWPDDWGHTPLEWALVYLALEESTPRRIQLLRPMLRAHFDAVSGLRENVYRSGGQASLMAQAKASRDRSSRDNAKSTAKKWSEIYGEGFNLHAEIRLAALEIHSYASGCEFSPIHEELAKLHPLFLPLIIGFPIEVDGRIRNRIANKIERKLGIIGKAKNPRAERIRRALRKPDPYEAALYAVDDVLEVQKVVEARHKELTQDQLGVLYELMKAGYPPDPPKWR
jgi:hypothetical protein